MEQKVEIFLNVIHKALDVKTWVNKKQAYAKANKTGFKIIAATDFGKQNDLIVFYEETD